MKSAYNQLTHLLPLLYLFVSNTSECPPSTGEVVFITLMFSIDRELSSLLYNTGAITEYNSDLHEHTIDVVINEWLR